MERRRQRAITVYAAMALASPDPPTSGGRHGDRGGDDGGLEGDRDSSNSSTSSSRQAGRQAGRQAWEGDDTKNIYSARFAPHWQAVKQLRAAAWL